jgi:hypothetical protein
MRAQTDGVATCTLVPRSTRPTVLRIRTSNMVLRRLLGESCPLLRLLRSFTPSLLHNCTVIARGDARNVYYILQKGGSAREHLETVCLEIFSLCLEHRLDLRPEWLPREENERADYLSKIRDEDNFGISPTAFDQVTTAFGPFSVDRFASPHNAKLPRFNAFFWCPGVEAVNAFSQNWGGNGVSFCFPPPDLVARTLQHSRACRARIALVVLGWRSAPWWPLLSGSVASGRGFATFVRRQLFFSSAREALVPGMASADQFCGMGVPLCDLYVLNVDFLCR